MNRIKDIIINLINGFCMALADSVPGVSGGTIAFLLGFYDNFINSEEKKCEYILYLIISKQNMDKNQNQVTK